MIRQMSRVADRAYDRDPGGSAEFYSFRQRVVEIALFIIAACGNVHDANIVFLSIRKHPLESLLNIFFGYPTGAGELYQNDIRIGRKAAIESIRQ